MPKMPKDMTKAQLRRALEEAQRKARTESAGWDRAADRVATLEDENIHLQGKRAAEQVRADIAESKAEKLNALVDTINMATLQHRAEAAELSLIHTRKALDTANLVNRELLKVIEKLQQPVRFLGPPGYVAQHMGPGEVLCSKEPFDG